MATSKLSARDFNQDTSRAKRAANDGPVIITERGKPTHVLMTMTEYERLSGKQISVLQALADPGADFDFDVPQLSDDWGFKSPDFD